MVSEFKIIERRIPSIRIGSSGDFRIPLLLRGLNQMGDQCGIDWQYNPRVGNWYASILLLAYFRILEIGKIA
jgi:hypothetical protein